MPRTHRYAVTTTWTGDRGTGTSGYRDYDRSLTTSAQGRPPLLGSADRAFRGDPGRWNPELLLVAALSQCHLLSYLHVCAEAGVVVTGYRDAAQGELEQEGNGGRITGVVLRPEVVVADAAVVDRARELHVEASRLCFIAASVAFPVRHEPVVTAAAPAPPSR
jgi:organic hydroperoxide reductase OsmC/OhrA